MSGKFAAQQKHIRKSYNRFSLDLRPEILDAFGKACEKNGVKRTTAIKGFIMKYIEDAGVTIDK